MTAVHAERTHHYLKSYPRDLRFTRSHGSFRLCGIVICSPLKMYMFFSCSPDGQRLFKSCKASSTGLLLFHYLLLFLFSFFFW